MEKVIVSKFKSRRTVRQAIRYLHKSLKPEDLRAVNAFVTEKDEIFVGAVLAPTIKEHTRIFVETVLGQGRIVEMPLDEFIDAAQAAPETYIGIASKIFPAVKP